MDFNKYQREASLTAKDSGIFDKLERLKNWTISLGGEVGEVQNLLKKALFHNHGLNPSIIQEELGDVLWYLSAIATEFELDLQTIAENNITKLRKRHGESYREEHYNRS